MVPWSFQEERHPADTPILDFRHLELSKNKSELFYATKFGVICHSDHRKLIYHPGRPECSDPPTMRFSLACAGTVAAPHGPCLSHLLVYVSVLCALMSY